jgi:MSHA pilin protein MshA
MQICGFPFQEEQEETGMKKAKGKKGNEGFTLIELVMVIVILGIMSVVAIPKYLDMQQEAKDSAAEGFVGALQSTLSMHIADHYLNGTAWVATGAELEALLEAGTQKPDGLTYNAGTETWSMDGGDSWTFAAAAGGNPPKVSKN